MSLLHTFRSPIFGCCLSSSESPVFGVAVAHLGGCSLPMILGHLTEQVLPEEVGALQGAAVTSRPLTSLSIH